MTWHSFAVKSALTAPELEFLNLTSASFLDVIPFTGFAISLVTVQLPCAAVA